jgi:hypothetical protein
MKSSEAISHVRMWLYSNVSETVSASKMLDYNHILTSLITWEDFIMKIGSLISFIVKIPQKL